MSYTIKKNGQTFAEVTAGMDQAAIDLETIWFDNAQLDEDAGLKINDIHFGVRMVALLSVLNTRNNITDIQTAAVYGSPGIMQIMNTLMGGSIITSLALVQALDLTGLEPITETERATMVSKLQEYLGV